MTVPRVYDNPSIKCQLCERSGAEHSTRNTDDDGRACEKKKTRASAIRAKLIEGVGTLSFVTTSSVMDTLDSQ